MSVHFRDTDPRPLPEPERRPVSQHYARAVERTGDADISLSRAVSKAMALDAAVAEAHRRAFERYPAPRDGEPYRRAYVQGYLDRWLEGVESGA